MAVEIPCPKCGAVLRAPEGSAGRKARCKKCQHSFRLPGDAAPDSSQEESQQLSVVDVPAFSFDAPAESKGSKSKYKSSVTASKRTGSKTQPKKSKTWLYALAGVVLLGGIAAAVYFVNEGNKGKETASAAPAPSPEKPAEPPKEKDKKEKEPAKKPDPKAPAAPKATDRKGRAIPALTGGYKLPPPPAKAEKLQKLSAKVGIEAPFGEIRTVFMSGGESPLAAVLVPGEKGFSGQGAKDFVDRYSVEGGTKLDRTEIDAGDGAWPRACGLSPNGDRFVSEGPAGTLTLYNLNEKAKSGTPFKPFAEGGNAALAAVFFTDEATVLAVAKNGSMETWKDGKRLAAGSLGGPVSENGLTLKPDRKTLLAMAGTNLVTASVSTLAASSGTPLPGTPLEAYAISFGSGDRVAVAYQASSPGTHTLLFITRLDESKPTQMILDSSYGIPNSIDWNGAETFTFATDKDVAVAVEMESKKPLASLWPSGGKAKHILANGRHAVLLPDPADEKKSLLVLMSFPPDDYLPLINEAKATNGPVGFLLTPEGFGR